MLTGDRADWFVRRAVVEVAAALQIHPRAILGRCRTKSIARARKLAYWLARETSGCSWPELALAFNRHHSSLLTAANEFNRALLDRDPPAVRLLGRLLGRGQGGGGVNGWPLDQGGRPAPIQPSRGLSGTRRRRRPTQRQDHRGSIETTGLSWGPGMPEQGVCPLAAEMGAADDGGKTPVPLERIEGVEGRPKCATQPTATSTALPERCRQSGWSGESRRPERVEAPHQRWRVRGDTSVSARASSRRRP